MDEYSIKLLSWIGISLVTTYRSFLSKPFILRKEYCPDCDDIEQNKALLCLPEPSTKQILMNLIKQDTDNLMKWISGDVQIIQKLMKEKDKKIPEWTKGETDTFHESMKFQMISFNRQPSLLTYQIIVVENLTTDQETLIKWVEENDKSCTVCSEEEKTILTKWIGDNQQTITESITKDTMKFYEMIQGLDYTLDEKTKKDIIMLTKTTGRSSINTQRHYNIVSSKTSNKNTMTEIGERALFEPGCPFALNITSTQVELKWEEPSVGAGFIDLYRIMCEEKHISVTCFFETHGNSCRYVVEGLKPNTEYAFKIQAVKNGQNRGPFSETLTVPTLEISCDRMAEAVSEPERPSALDITSTRVELEWDKPSVGSDFIHCYQIICKDQSSSRQCLFKTPRNDCNYVVDGLKPNTEYAFKIQAGNNSQIRGPYSETLTVSTLEISFDITAEFLYVLFYIAVLIWFTYLFCYTVTTT